MGCGNTREDIEDKIMVIRLKRTNIQLEREKNLKILSELEGYPINMDNLADYLASSKKGKPIKYSSRNKYTEILIKNIKNKLNFMKDISNFTYPKILTYKIKSFEEKIKNNKIEKKKFFSPVMERNKQFKIRNKLRENYLFNCISISKFKNISPNP